MLIYIHISDIKTHIEHLFLPILNSPFKTTIIIIIKLIIP
nr:MAG TPA: hypothetical protein [Caudoviricetes sp.]